MRPIQNSLSGSFSSSQSNTSQAQVSAGSLAQVSQGVQNLVMQQASATVPPGQPTGVTAGPPPLEYYVDGMKVALMALSQLTGIDANTVGRLNTFCNPNNVEAGLRLQDHNNIFQQIRLTGHPPAYEVSGPVARQIYNLFNDAIKLEDECAVNYPQLPGASDATQPVASMSDKRHTPSILPRPDMSKRTTGATSSLPVNVVAAMAKLTYFDIQQQRRCLEHMGNNMFQQQWFQLPSSLAGVGADFNDLLLDSSGPRPAADGAPLCQFTLSPAQIRTLLPLVLAEVTAIGIFRGDIARTDDDGHYQAVLKQDGYHFLLDSLKSGPEWLDNPRAYYGALADAGGMLAVVPGGASAPIKFLNVTQALSKGGLDQICDALGDVLGKQPIEELATRLSTRATLVADDILDFFNRIPNPAVGIPVTLPPPFDVRDLVHELDEENVDNLLLLTASTPMVIPLFKRDGQWMARVRVDMGGRNMMLSQPLTKVMQEQQAMLDRMTLQANANGNTRREAEIERNRMNFMVVQLRDWPAQWPPQPFILTVNDKALGGHVKQFPDFDAEYLNVPDRLNTPGDKVNHRRKLYELCDAELEAGRWSFVPHSDNLISAFTIMPEHCAAPIGVWRLLDANGYSLLRRVPAPADHDAHLGAMLKNSSGSASARFREKLQGLMPINSRALSQCWTDHKEEFMDCYLPWLHASGATLPGMTYMKYLAKLAQPVLKAGGGTSIGNSGGITAVTIRNHDNTAPLKIWLVQDDSGILRAIRRAPADNVGTGTTEKLLATLETTLTTSRKLRKDPGVSAATPTHSGPQLSATQIYREWSLLQPQLQSYLNRWNCLNGTALDGPAFMHLINDRCNDRVRMPSWSKLQTYQLNRGGSVSMTMQLFQMNDITDANNTALQIVRSYGGTRYVKLAIPVAFDAGNREDRLITQMNSMAANLKVSEGNVVAHAAAKAARPGPSNPNSDFDNWALCATELGEQKQKWADACGRGEEISGPAFIREMHAMCSLQGSNPIALGSRISSHTIALVDNGNVAFTFQLYRLVVGKFRQIRRIPGAENEKKTIVVKMMKAPQNAARNRFNFVHKSEEATTDVSRCFNKWNAVKDEFNTGFVAWNLARDADDTGKLYLRHLSVCCTREDLIPGQGGIVVASKTIEGNLHQIKRYTINPIQSLDPANPLPNPPRNPPAAIDVFRLHDPTSKFVTLRMGTQTRISHELKGVMFDELERRIKFIKNQAAKAQA